MKFHFNTRSVHKQPKAVHLIRFSAFSHQHNQQENLDKFHRAIQPFVEATNHRISASWDLYEAETAEIGAKYSRDLNKLKLEFADNHAYLRAKYPSGVPKKEQTNEEDRYNSAFALLNEEYDKNVEPYEIEAANRREEIIERFYQDVSGIVNDYKERMRKLDDELISGCRDALGESNE